MIEPSSHRHFFDPTAGAARVAANHHGRTTETVARAVRRVLVVAGFEVDRVTTIAATPDGAIRVMVKVSHGQHVGAALVAAGFDCVVSPDERQRLAVVKVQRSPFSLDTVAAAAAVSGLLPEPDVDAPPIAA